MDLITTHINADFDALGSLVAAKKLYPDSRLLLPGSQEKAVREFLALAKEEIAVESERECRLDDVTKLIVVDTSHKSRIGIASELVEKGVEVHVYDHHPRTKDDIRATKTVYEEVGSTVTILTDIIKKRRIKLSYLEATIMLLGIYEETGSLTYRATTKLDVDMVSFLLSQGASLAVVSSYINRELTEGELSLLTRLINSTERIPIKGVNVSIAEIDAGSYSGELGMVISKLEEIENIPAFFVLIKTGANKIDIIGRSSIANINVNRILSHFGGGGHAGAASAHIKTGDMVMAREKLLKLLRAGIKEKVYAKDIMSLDVKTVNPNTRVTEARTMLLEHHVSGLPVIERGRIAGVASLRDMNKAIRNGFGHSRVKGYMSHNIATVTPNTPMHVIRNMALGKDIGTIIVLHKKKIAGVINRSDILKSVYSALLTGPREINKRFISNLSGKIRSILPGNAVDLLMKIGAMADKEGYPAFIVGGVVRDLILGKKNLDLDIVIEGDAIKIGSALAREMGASLVTHKRFGTCTVVAKNKLKIDFATARKEIYAHPAALPTVEFSTIKEDLIRRDFTINAMAMSINKKNFGQLIDFFGGEQDLERGRIRVMHDKSFIDDPTRIFRAVRFEQRFGFSIDPRTEELIQTALEERMFERVEPQRVRDEIILIMKEEDPLKAVKRMADLHELRFIHNKIRLDQKMVKFYRNISKICYWYENAYFRKRPLDEWLMYLVALFEELSYNETLSICKKFVFKRGEEARILSYKKDARKIIRVITGRSILPSKVYRLLEELSYEVILLSLARSGSNLMKRRVKDFFERYNGSRISVRGEDLRRLGLKPGPRFKNILDKILLAKIDGRVKTRQEELAYACKLAGKGDKR